MELAMSRLQLRNNPELLDARLLTQQLAAEFDNYDAPSQDYHQPLINMEAALGRIHLLVIWDAWYAFSQQERSRMIMDAFEASQGSESALRVSVAMGLTQDDAAHLGVDFVPTRT